MMIQHRSAICLGEPGAVSQEGLRALGARDPLEVACPLLRLQFLRLCVRLETGVVVHVALHVPAGAAV